MIYKPSVVLWNITNKCNLRCSYCYNSNKSDINECIEKIEIKYVCHDLQQAGCEELVIAGGEPLLSSRLSEIIQDATSQKIKVSVITNGTIYTKEYVDLFSRYDIRVGVSVDGIDEYSNQCRGSEVNIVLKTIDNYISANIDVEMLVTVTKYNISQLDAIVGYCLSKGIAKLNLQQIHAEGAAKKRYFDLIPDTEQVDRAWQTLREIEEENLPISIEHSELTFFRDTPGRFKKNCNPEHDYKPAKLLACGAGRRFCVISSDLNILPCNALYNHPAGNLTTQSFKEIWESSHVFLMIRNIRNKRSDKLIGCQECQYNPVCDGGCRADSFNIYNNWYYANPACPYSKT